VLKVILQQKVRNKGDVGDIVSVSSGYARNHLLPKQIALLANKENISATEARFKDLAEQEKVRVAAANKKIKKIEACSPLVLTVPATDDGKLYGSIGPADVVRLLAEHDLSVNKTDVYFPEGVVRYVGEHHVEVDCYEGMMATLRLDVHSNAAASTEEEGEPEQIEAESSADEADTDQPAE